MNTVFNVEYIEEDDSTECVRACRVQVAAILEILFGGESTYAERTPRTEGFSEDKPPESTPKTVAYNDRCKNRS